MLTMDQIFNNINIEIFYTLGSGNGESGNNDRSSGQGNNQQDQNKDNKVENGAKQQTSDQNTQSMSN